jgi:hypothetical protein
MLRSLPASFEVVARRLMRRVGVVGVFWGAKHPRRQGRGHLRVHVREKIDRPLLPTRRLIDKEVEGLRTCIVEVGEPESHLLTLKELVHPAADNLRNSALTTLVCEGDQWFALLSGHGTLPIRNGAIETCFDANGTDYAIKLRDVSSGMDLEGSLVTGRIGQSLDFAVARIVMPDEPIALECPVTESRRPPIRTAVLNRGEPVRQFSCRDRTMRDGTVTGYGMVRLKLDDQNTYAFNSVFEVHGLGDPFSCKGDSGSLVADNQGRVVGVVIGGTGSDDERDPASYVLPFVSPTGSVHDNLQRFFS